VVTASGGMRETMIDGRGATIIQPGDVGTLARASIDLLRDAERCRVMGVLGARHVAGLSLDAYLDDLERVYGWRER
jgi:glycosyltransferase involved in cell wall biosynthesis